MSYICPTFEMSTKRNTSKTQVMRKNELFWVIGDHIKGFKIVTKKPRTKHVPEPHQSLELAKRWIAMQFLLNA